MNTGLHTYFFHLLEAWKAHFTYKITKVNLKFDTFNNIVIVKRLVNNVMEAYL